MRQISAQTSRQAASAIKNVTFAGVFSPQTSPSAAAMSDSFGRCVGAAKLAEAGSMLPTGRSTFTSM